MICKYISLQEFYRVSRRVAIVSLMLLLSGFALPQSQPISDTQVWIEFPFDGINLPNQTITFVVYATDANGISGINLKINGESLPSSQAFSISTDGSGLMARLDQEWQPPAEGEYTLEASASGASTSVSFCVVTCQPETIQEPVDATPTWTPTPAPADIDTPTATPTVTSSETPTPLPYISPTPTPYIESSAEFWAAPPYINEGECTTLNWNVSGDFQSVYYESSLVNASSSQQECPMESYTYHLQVTEMDNSTTDYWASVDVSEPPPADTSGPTISYVGHFWEGCSIFGEANITDPSGVTWAEFWFNHNEEGWAWIQMNQSGDQWVSQAGIDTDGFAGSLVYKVRTLDSVNNESWSGEYIHNYAYCGE